MKILFLLRSLDYGGAERQLVLLAKGLCERGHDVVVAVFYSGDTLGSTLEGELRDARVRFHSLNKAGRWDVFGFIVRLIRFLRDERPDILHTYLFDPNLLAVMLKPLFSKSKVASVL